MKKTLALLLFAMPLLPVLAQSSTVVDDKNAQVRNVSGFHGVHIQNGIDLYISQGSAEGVAISASDPKFLQYIKTEVQDGILKIYIDQGEGWHVSWGDRKLKAYVTVKDISELHASGGSDVYVEGTLQSSALDMHLSGGSDFHGKLDAGALTLRQSGGSDVKISGKAGSININASGGSDFIGYEFVSDNCDIDASGGSDVYITVNKQMNVRASGGSDVSYKGTCVIKNYDASGSSDIKKKG